MSNLVPGGQCDTLNKCTGFGGDWILMLVSKRPESQGRRKGGRGTVECLLPVIVPLPSRTLTPLFRPSGGPLLQSRAESVMWRHLRSGGKRRAGLFLDGNGSSRISQDDSCPNISSAADSQCVRTSDITPVYVHKSGNTRMDKERWMRPVRASFSG